MNKVENKFDGELEIQICRLGDNSLDHYSVALRFQTFSGSSRHITAHASWHDAIHYLLLNAQCYLLKCGSALNGLPSSSFGERISKYLANTHTCTHALEPLNIDHRKVSS